MKTPDQDKQPLMNEVYRLRERIAELEAVENDRTQTEKALRESEDRLRIILDSVQTGIVIIDYETHRIVDANAIASRLIGASKGQINGSLCHQFICPAEEGKCPITDLGQTVDNSERVLLTAGGGKCPIIKTVVPVFLGGRQHLLESFVDITERKRYEEVLRETEDRYRLLFETSTNAVLIRDQEGIIHLANPTAVRMLKASKPDEIIGKPYLDLIRQEDRLGSVERIQRQIKAVQGEPGIDPACKLAPLREHRLLALDGETIYVESTGVAFWHQGQLWIQGIFHDITQRKQAEEALRKSEEVARRMAYENSIVAEIGRIISSSLSIEDIYESFAEKAHQLISFDRISISIINHEKGTFWNAYHSGDVISGRKIMEEVSLAGSFTEEVMGNRARGIIGLENTDEVARRFPKLLPFWQRGYRSFMAFPLISNDQVVGVLHINSMRPKAYNEEDASLGERIAAQISGAIANSKHFQERKRAEEALESSLSLLQATLQSTADGVLVVDRTGKVTIYNQKFLSLWQIPDSLVNSKDDDQLLQYVLEQLQDPEAFLDKVKALYTQPELESFDVLEFKDGRVFERLSKPQRVGEEIIGRVWSFRDVTEQRQTQMALQKSEKNYRLLADNASDTIWTMDMGLNFTYISPSVTRNRGYSVEEAMPQRIAEVLTPTSLELARKAFAEELALERMGQKDLSRSRTLELEQKCKNGSTVWTESTLTFIRDPDGRAIGILGVTRDVTERRGAEDAIRKNEERFRDLYDGAPLGYHEYDTKGLITNVNCTDLEMLGYSREEMIGQFMWKFNVEEDIARTQISEKLAGLRPPGRSLERTYRRKDGTTFPVLIEDRLTKGEQGRITGIRCIIQDITERKKMEEALRESESRYRTVIENIQDIFYRTDKGGFLTMASPSAAHLLGYDSLDEIIGKPIGNFWKDPQKQADLMRRIREEGPVTDYEVTAKKKDGSPVLVSTSCAFYRDETGKILGIEGIIRDIAERKRAEQALRESEERYRVLAEGTSEAVLLRRSDGRIVYANPAALELLHATKREDLVGRDYLEFVHPDDREESAGRIQRGMREGWAAPRREHRLVALDGQVVDVESTGLPLLHQGQWHILGVFHDITEQKRAEKEKNALQEQLHQSQKMEAIGKLAGGIAHDFNNLLTVINTHAQIALMELRSWDPLKGNLEPIQKAGERAANLTRQLLAFSRRQVVDMKVIDLNTLLQELGKMLIRVMGEDIELSTVLDKGLGRVKADPGQIEQVILNLVVNAKDAMPSGGKLIIETAQVELDREYSHTHLGMKPGRYVMLSVSDTGVGMSPEVRERVFEPFFTTKEKGKGTGLGLSSVYGVVKQCGGFIWVYSEPGQGTTFKIYLPQVEEPLEEEVRKKVGRDRLPGGRETILVVEDEEEVRKLAVAILRKQGYRILEASNGGDAFLICEQGKEKVQLLLTDVVMPGLNGPELSRRLMYFYPEMKVLYMSGYTDNTIFQQGVLDHGMFFLQKPFSLEGLTGKVREALDN